MAIGEQIDLVAYKGLKRTAICYHLVEGKAGSSASKASMADAVWNEKTLEPFNVPSQWKAGELLSLKGAIARDDQAVAMVYDGRGVDAISVPFNHYLLVTGPGNDISPLPFIKNLRENLYGAFGPYYGHQGKIRVGCFSTVDITENEALLFSGYGIYSPGADEPLVGIVTLVKEGDESEILSPMLPDGRVAGFYKDQQGLSFSSSRELTPAVVPDLPADHVFFLGRFPHEERKHGVGAPEIKLYCDVVHGADGGGRASAQAVEYPDLPLTEDMKQVGWDGAYQISVDRVSRFTLYYAKDIRNSRLRKVPPEAGSYFVVAGFAPGPFTQRFERFWMELSGQGGRGTALVHSALCQPWRSLVATNGRADLYSWASFEFESGGKCPQFKWNGKRHDALLHEGLGYIALPDPGQNIRFNTAPGMSGHKQDADVYPLDWIDHSCKVERLDGSVVGLASVLAENLVYNYYEEGSQKKLRGGDMPVLVAGDGGVNFADAYEVALEPGMRLIIGGIILDYHG